MNEKLLVILKKDKNMEEEKMNGNKTIDNLMDAFAGESQANRKYLAYSKKAEKDGKINAAKLFKAASDAETIHALKHFEVAGKVGSTSDNLADAVAGDLVGGELQRHGLGEAGDAVLGRHIGRLERRGDQRMRRGGVDDAAPAALLHAGHRGANAVKR